MDVAASEFYVEGKYDLDFKTANNDKSQIKTGAELQELYKHFVANFPVISIEDPFDEDDWDSYASLTKVIGKVKKKKKNKTQKPPIMESLLFFFSSLLLLTISLFSSFFFFFTSLSQEIQIVGDDLLVTNPKRIQKAIDNNTCNALLLKVNQIGSVTESIKACIMAQAAGWGVMVTLFFP